MNALWNAAAYQTDDCYRCIPPSLKDLGTLLGRDKSLACLPLSLRASQRTWTRDSSSSSWQGFVRHRQVKLSCMRKKATLLTIVQLMHSLCNRKPFPICCAAPAVRTSSPALDFLFDLAFRVPPLLESVDALERTDNNVICISDRLKNELASLERALVVWLGSFCESKSHTGRELTASAVAHDTDRSPEGHELKSAKPPCLFELACESLCRVCLLLIYQSHISLESPNDCTKLSQSLYDSSAVVCAHSLRHLVGLLGGVAERPIAQGLALRAPLHFLEQWYSYSRDNDGLLWCAETTKAVRARAPYLQWDALMPWSLMPLIKVPA